MRHFGLQVMLPALLLCAGCERAKTTRLIGVEDEKQANEIITLLHQATGSDRIVVSGEKGQRGKEWIISVPEDLLALSRDLLADHNLPRKAHPSLANLPAAQGWMPSDMEDHARREAALAGEVEDLLRQYARVVDVKARVSLPVHDRLANQSAPPPSVSVVVSYLTEVTDGADQRPVEEDDVRRMVAGAIAGVRDADVIVRFAPRAPRARAIEHAELPVATRDESRGRFLLFNWTAERVVALSIATGMLMGAAVLLLLWRAQRKSRTAASAAEAAAAV